MGELIADLFITLDGYAYGEGAPAYFGYPGPELERWVDEHLAMPQVLLMGRVTYEALSAIAQNHPVEGPDRMRELPKVVCRRRPWTTEQKKPRAGSSRSTREKAKRCGGWGGWPPSKPRPSRPG